MAQPHPPKGPVDALQGMINAILIETGKALRPSDKEGGRTMANSSHRLRLTIPNAIDHFHQALDELEAEIVRAKSVLGRDLETLRSKRIAAENPPQLDVIEEAPAPQPASPPSTLPEEELSAPIKEETVQENPAATTPEVETAKQIQVKQDSPKEPAPQGEEGKGSDLLSPPSLDENKSQAIGLGIDTTMLTSTDDTAPTTTGGQDSSIDSLFDMPDSANNDDAAALNFDNMDFSMPDSGTNTQNQQTQNIEFDLSTFGNNSQDFNMSDLQPSNEITSTTNTNNPSNDALTNKQGDLSTDDFLNMTAGSGGADANTNTNNNNDNNTTDNNNNNSNNNMDLDLDLGNMVGAEDSVFDDMFFGDDDNGNLGGDLGSMEHGQFDNAFFGID
ncbi:hypothetical protein CJF31_00007981 [Rutstroemia sp. NJR-2017a BVV2]|nr:hypothetical protein CJF31_00007981 [Rutstroemia sp. NJR-2017a BVV2]